MKKLLILLLAFGMLLSMGSCRKAQSETDEDTEETEVTVKTNIADEDYETVTVISGKVLEIGESYSFKRLWNDAEYRSAKPSVASVDQAGTISAKSAGTVMVMAKSEEEERSSAIIISVLPEGESVDSRATGPQVHQVNSAYQLQPTIAATSYTSSDDSIVEVNQSGLLQFHSAGYATVTVQGNGVTEIYSYIVYDRAVEE
ncbi:MAG: hypothetical protein KHW59_01985 [Clostridiales bacterium]|nr:hypothetical protein [Clostridiales bacterium]